jgi:hypothetical protein
MLLVCCLLDLAIVTLATLVVVILVTGGTLFHIGGVAIGLRSVDNPLAELAGLLVLRYLARDRAPFLLIPRLRLSNIDSASRDAAARLLQWLSAMGWRDTRRVLVTLCVGAILTKLAAAWWLPGFFSGDDVEIHEMTFSALFRDRGWPIWELRNAFFPMVFIYPAQLLAVGAGFVDPRSLVFAGRASVAFLSTLAIPLTWLAVRRVFPNDRATPLIAAALLTLNKLHMSFGSSELPRPVASVFVLSAFIVILASWRGTAIVAGLLLGCAAAFRFSEAVFLVPAVLMLLRERRVSDVVRLTVSSAIAAALVVGLADWIYWGEPFASARAAVEYTLVDRLSSRGYEPFYQYLRLVPAWSNVVIVALAIAGSIGAPRVALWTWVPIVMLSFLPHKEERYLIPVMPFLAIAAARGIARTVITTRNRDASRSARTVGAFVLPVLILALLQEAGGWRLARANHGVRLVEHLRAQGVGGFAGEHTWRLGGRPYLHAFSPLIELDDARLRDAHSRAQAFKDVKWIVVRKATASRLDPAELERLGFSPYEWEDVEYVTFARRPTGG